MSLAGSFGVLTTYQLVITNSAVSGIVNGNIVL